MESEEASSVRTCGSQYKRRWSLRRYDVDSHPRTRDIIFPVTPVSVRVGGRVQWVRESLP